MNSFIKLKNLVEENRAINESFIEVNDYVKKKKYKSILIVDLLNSSMNQHREKIESDSSFLKNKKLYEKSLLSNLESIKYAIDELEKINNKSKEDALRKTELTKHNMHIRASVTLQEIK